MSKKQQKESQVEQSERFVQTAHDLEAAGELNATEAEAVLERIVKNLKTPKKD